MDKNHSEEPPCYTVPDANYDMSITAWFFCAASQSNHDQLVITRMSETPAGLGKFFQVPGVVICAACVAYYYAVDDTLPLGFINITALGFDTAWVRL